MLAKEQFFPGLHYLGLEFLITYSHGYFSWGVTAQHRRYCEDLLRFERDGELRVDSYNVANLRNLDQTCQQAGVHLGRSKRSIWRKAVWPFARKGEQEIAWIGRSERDRRSP